MPKIAVIDSVTGENLLQAFTFDFGKKEEDKFVGNLYKGTNHPPEVTITHQSLQKFHLLNEHIIH